MIFIPANVHAKSFVYRKDLLAVLKKNLDRTIFDTFRRIFDPMCAMVMEVLDALILFTGSSLMEISVYPGSFVEWLKV